MMLCNEMAAERAGQKWTPETKSRRREPRVNGLRGRSRRTGPIGYGDGMGQFGYVSGDPINLSDPSGLSPDPERCHLPGEEPCEGTGEEMVVNAILGPSFAALRFSGGGGGGFGGGGGGFGGAQDNEDPKPIVVTADRCLAARQEAGNVNINTVAGWEATFLVGYTYSRGFGINTLTGTTFDWESSGFTVGLSAGTTVGGMETYNSLGDFVGFSEGFSIGADIPRTGGRLGIGYSRTWNIQGDVVGEGGSYSIMSTRAGISANSSVTTISNCRL